MAYKTKDQVKFLADVSRILSSSLDYNVTLKNVARLAVTHFTDFCMIDLFEKDGKLHRVAARHEKPDAEQKKLALEMFQYPADPRNKKAIYEAARMGKPILIKRFSQTWLNKSSKMPGEHRVAKKLGLSSLIFVPLKSRKKVIGVLSLFAARKGFTYSEKDVLLAQELADRAGMAVDNAHLFMESQEALKLRDLFIAMAAHELRTPLTTISGYIQLLHQKLKGVNTQEGRWVEDLVYESSRLTKLVNELLEVNRIKIGKFEFLWQECSLNAVIMRAIAEFHFTHPKRGVIFQSKVAEDRDMVIGDFNKLLQLLVNLLDNAAKFSVSDSEISLSLDSKSKYFCLIVSDQGKGIARRDLPGIFEKFHKGSDHTKEGIGLGLFLAKIITSEHRGKIEIESKVNKGTDVRVLLPKIGK